MATSTEKLELLIGVIDKASPVLSKLKSAVIGIGAAYLGWQGVTRIIGDIIEKAAESERVWNDVAASLDRHGYAVENSMSVVQSFGSELQRLTGISDELGGRAIQTLLDYQVDLADSFDMVRTAADMAAARNIDLTTAVDLVGKAFAGNTASLSRYGIIVNQNLSQTEKFQEVMRQMNERFGGAAQAQLQTYSGQLKLFKENIGDLEEEIGKVLLPSLTEMTSELSKFTKRLSTDYGSALDNIGTKFVALSKIMIEFFEGGGPFKIDKSGPVEKFLEAADSSAVAFDKWRASVIASTEGASLAFGDFDSYYRSIFNKVKTETENTTAAVKELNHALSGMVTDLYPTLTSSADNFLSTMIAQNEETEKTRAILQDLADKGVHYLITSLELTEEQIVEVIKMAEDMGIQFRGHVRIMAQDAVSTAEEMGLAFEAGIGAGFTNTASWAAAGVGSSLRRMADESRGYFTKMYLHFVSYFADAALEYMAKFFVRKLLSYLSIFDVAANDRFAMQQGRDFAFYFSSGVLSGIREQNLGMAIAGEIGGSYSGRVSGSAMTSRAIRRQIVPVIQREAKYGITTLITSESSVTGARVGYVS